MCRNLSLKTPQCLLNARAFVQFMHSALPGYYICISRKIQRLLIARAFNPCMQHLLSMLAVSPERHVLNGSVRYSCGGLLPAMTGRSRAEPVIYGLTRNRRNTRRLHCKNISTRINQFTCDPLKAINIFHHNAFCHNQHAKDQMDVWDFFGIKNVMTRFWCWYLWDKMCLSKGNHYCLMIRQYIKIYSFLFFTTWSNLRAILKVIDRQ